MSPDGGRGRIEGGEQSGGTLIFHLPRRYGAREDLLSHFGFNAPADCQDKSLWSVVCLMEGFKLVFLEVSDRLGAANVGIGIGVGSVKGLVKRLGCHLGGILVLDRDTGQDLIADPFKLFFSKSRFLDDLHQQAPDGLKIFPEALTEEGG